jgi:hypothetical protein
MQGGTKRVSLYTYFADKAVCGIHKVKDLVGFCPKAKQSKVLFSEPEQNTDSVLQVVIK